jgi:hypothetical protein
MGDIIKPLTDAEQHADMNAFIGCERPMRVNKSRPLGTGRLERRGERRESRHGQNDPRIVAGVSRLATAKADLVPSCVVASTVTANLPPGEVDGTPSEDWPVPRGASGCFSSHAHHPAAKPAVSTKPTGAGATLIAQRNPPASTPTRKSAVVRDKPDVTLATFPLIEVHAVVPRFMFSA